MYKNKKARFLKVCFRLRHRAQNPGFFFKTGSSSLPAGIIIKNPMFKKKGCFNHIFSLEHLFFFMDYPTKKYLRFSGFLIFFRIPRKFRIRNSTWHVLACFLWLREYARSSGSLSRYGSGHFPC